MKELEVDPSVVDSFPEKILLEEELVENVRIPQFELMERLGFHHPYRYIKRLRIT